MKNKPYSPFVFRMLALPFTFVLMAGHSNAQVHTFNTKQGDEFKRYIVTKSNCVLQRGEYKLSVNSYSEITKSYKVTSAGDKSVDLTVTTNKVVDSTYANGEHIVFNSDKNNQGGSTFQRMFSDLLSQPAVLSVDVSGKVTLVSSQSSPDEVSLAFVGIPSDHYAPGNLLEIAFDFPVSVSLKKGDSWTDSTTTTVTKFTVYAINGRLTTITYTSSDKPGSLNSNINGSLLIDNQSGIILKRATKSVTVGYESVNGVVYTAIRRTSTMEACVKDAK